MLIFINCSGYKKLNEALVNPENVTKLKIKNRHLDSLPKEIGKLTSLIELNVAFCGPMVQIPETIRYCRSLEFLHIDRSLLLSYSINSVNPRLQVIVKEKGELN
jgi:hypothetical protein